MSFVVRTIEGEGSTTFSFCSFRADGKKNPHPEEKSPFGVFLGK